MHRSDSPQDMEVLQEQYERSLEKWSSKLGRAKKDVSLCRMETMEARLEGDILLEDVLEGIHRMEALHRHIGKRFTDEGPLLESSAAKSFHDMLVNLTASGETSTLTKEDASHLFACYTEFCNDHAAAVAHLAGQVEASESAIRQREREQLKKDAHFKKMTNLWQRDLQKQSAEMTQMRKRLLDAQCEFQAFQAEKEQQVNAMQRVIDALRDNVASYKNTEHLSSSGDSFKLNCGDESTDGETENEQELHALRGELAMLKRELCSLVPSDGYADGGGGGDSREIFFQVSSNLTISKWEHMATSQASRPGGETVDVDLCDVIQRFRSQQQLHVDQIQSLQQQVVGLKERLRFKVAENDSLRVSLTEKSMELKDNQHHMQATMEALRAQVDRLQSNMCNQTAASSSPSGGTPDHHNVDSLSK
ncbi:unnamed protein product, partial [Symbiodinium microadriaticum]